VGPRAVLDAVVKGKTPSPCRASNPRTQIVQPVAQWYTGWVITVLPQEGGKSTNRQQLSHRCKLNLVMSQYTRPQCNQCQYQYLYQIRSVSPQLPYRTGWYSMDIVWCEFWSFHSGGEAARTSETSVSYNTTGLHNPEVWLAPGRFTFRISTVAQYSLILLVTD